MSTEDPPCHLAGMHPADCPAYVAGIGDLRQRVEQAVARPASRWVTCQYRQEPHELDDECVTVTDVPWTPGAGWERVKITMPGIVPELTEEDMAPLKARFLEAMRHPARFVVLPPTDDEREQAAYARGITEGLRRADNAINWHTSCLGCADRLDSLYAERSAGHAEGLADGRRQATEGWEREWVVDCGAITLQVDTEERVRRHVANSDSQCRALSRLVGPWEPAEQSDLGEADWPGHQNFTLLPCIKIEGPHPKHTWSHRGEPCEGHVCPGDPPAEHLGTSHTPPTSSHTREITEEDFDA